MYNKYSPIVSALQVSVADSLADVRRAAKVDYFDTVRLPGGLDQHYVLGLQVGMDQAQLLENMKKMVVKINTIGVISKSN